MEEKKKRITRCRYSLPHCIGGSIEYHCVAGGWKDDEVRVCTEEQCEQCIRFNSRYIEYPIFVNKIENRQKLTPIEYERLQGLPDGFTDVMLNGRKMSDTKRYSMMGNGWNEPTVEWILSGLKKR